MRSHDEVECIACGYVANVAAVVPEPETHQRTPTLNGPPWTAEERELWKDEERRRAFR